jgi:hypothetical protein
MQKPFCNQTSECFEPRKVRVSGVPNHTSGSNQLLAILLTQHSMSKYTFKLEDDNSLQTDIELTTKHHHAHTPQEFSWFDLIHPERHKGRYHIVHNLYSIVAFGCMA